MQSIDPLSPDAGADFFGVIDRIPEGKWRAIATCRKLDSELIQDEFIAIETFASEKAAYDWLKKEAVARNFRNIQITSRVGGK
jgi:hypothetical protein